MIELRSGVVSHIWLENKYLGEISNCVLGLMHSWIIKMTTRHHECGWKVHKEEALWFSSAFLIFHSSRVIFRALLHWNLYQFMFYCLARKYARNIIMCVTNRPTARYYGLTYNKFTRNKCRSSHNTKRDSCSLDMFWNRIFVILSEKERFLEWRM